MCSLCDEAVKLLEQTGNTYDHETRTWTSSVVQFSFPGGKPELIVSTYSQGDIDEEDT